MTDGVEPQEISDFLDHGFGIGLDFRQLPADERDEFVYAIALDSFEWEPKTPPDDVLGWLQESILDAVSALYVAGRLCSSSFSADEARAIAAKTLAFLTDPDRLLASAAKLERAATEMRNRQN